MTPPDADALWYDIEMTKKMGFNGVRKHQKMEDPRFYYLADRMGLLVWGEMPSGYEFCNEEISNVVVEWMEFVKQSYNHPCIITWVPFNESWGIRNVLNDVRQQEFVKTLYHLTKAIDPGRLVSSNDGWEQLEDSDICGIHNYIPDAIKNCPDICGYCYTQLSDVMQEANGLMDYERKPKADVEKIREINERQAKDKR